MYVYEVRCVCLRVLGDTFLHAPCPPVFDTLCMLTALLLLLLYLALC